MIAGLVRQLNTAHPQGKAKRRFLALSWVLNLLRYRLQASRGYAPIEKPARMGVSDFSDEKGRPKKEVEPVIIHYSAATVPPSTRHSGAGRANPDQADQLAFLGSGSDDGQLPLLADGSRKPSSVQWFGDEEVETAVVIMGWLGARHRHLQSYAKWYTSRGIHAICFVVPLWDFFTIREIGSGAEKRLISLSSDLQSWLTDNTSPPPPPTTPAPEGSTVVTVAGRDAGCHTPATRRRRRQLLFHTFSNTGWMGYGKVLQQLYEKLGGREVVDGMVKGCIVDSAPMLKQDADVWARGFAAALLARKSAATRLASLQPPADTHSPTHSKSRGAKAKGMAGGAWQPRRLPSAADLVAVGEGTGNGGKHDDDEGLERGKDGRSAAVVVDEEEVLTSGGPLGEWDDRREAEVEKRKVAEGWVVVRNRHGLFESVLVFVFGCIAAVLLPMPNSRRKLAAMSEILEHQQPSCPQLYVYSASDLVIPVTAVESFAAGQRKSGRPVSLLRFECSPHVDHLRTFPRAYQDKMHKFVSKCLA